MGRSSHRTGWAGALAVAAELSRRAYDVTIALGNTPTLDLLCASPTGRTFKMQVKSLTYPNWVFIRSSAFTDPPADDLYFVVVMIPPDPALPFEYYFLTHAEACALHAQHPQVRKDGQPYKPGGDGLAWAEVRPHRGRWDKLPE